MVRKLLVAIIALFVVSGSVSAFAYWDNLTQTESQSITLGEGVSLVVGVNAAPPSGKVLIPTTATVREPLSQVQSVVTVYDVNLDTSLSSPLAFTVAASNIQIGGSTTHAGLVTVDIVKAANEVNATAVEVTVTVTIAEPADQTAYDAIKNQPITFDLTFDAS